MQRPLGPARWGSLTGYNRPVSVTAQGCSEAGRHEPARRRARVSGGGGGYQARRGSNSKAGADWTSGSAAKLPLHMFRHRPLAIVTVAFLQTLGCGGHVVRMNLSLGRPQRGLITCAPNSLNARSMLNKR